MRGALGLSMLLLMACASADPPAPPPQLESTVAQPPREPPHTDPVDAPVSGAETYGELRVHLRGSGDHAVLLLHGYGAPGDDLVPLGESLARALPGTRFVMPEAPQIWIHGGDGRAWYERRRDDVPRQIDAARAALVSVLEALEAREGIPPARVVYAGFSMGATMSVELALNGPHRPAALVVLSGNALPRFREWARLRDLRVFVSHGHADEVLPFRHGARFRDRAEGSGATLTFVEFEGGHAIPGEVVRPLVSFLEGTWSAPSSAEPAP